MCNQSVGLIASVIEKSGIPTVCLSLLREVSEKVRPPRTLFVPFPIGYPLGAPDQPELQHSIIRAALDLLNPTGSLPYCTLSTKGCSQSTALSRQHRRSVRLGRAGFQRASSVHRPRFVPVARFFTNYSLVRPFALNPVHGAIHPLCFRSCAPGKPSAQYLGLFLRRSVAE